MPHVIIKMYSGRPDEKKQEMVDSVAKAVRESLGVDDSVISVSVEEYDREKWAEEVYKPDILEKPGTLMKKPGY